MDRLLAYAKALYACGHPVVLAGDFNVVPTDIDIYNPKSWLKDALLQPAPREKYRQLLGQGWMDAIRHLNPDKRIYTFWDYFRQHWPRDAGLRIDHLLLNETLAPRLVDAGVDRWVRAGEKASDHAPTWITIADGDEVEVDSSPPAPRRAKSARGPAAPPRARRKGT
jgi:exodeoxyribonuclease-3